MVVVVVAGHRDYNWVHKRSQSALADENFRVGRQNKKTVAYAPGLLLEYYRCSMWRYE